MKFRLLFLALAIFVLSPQAFAKGGWKKSQLEAADLARNNPNLSDREKEAIQYINLCRLYPQEFAENEVAGYEMSPGFGKDYLRTFAQYKNSLMQQLRSTKPVNGLTADNVLIDDADCFASELSRTGRVSHERHKCGPRKGNGECLSFGMEGGREIALQWLIDAGVSSLGHRKICLDAKYSRIGVKTASHKEYDVCAVAEFK
jgi:uncharacterized protein YkwD